MNWTRGAELLSNLNMTAFVLFASALLLAAFFTFVYRQKRQEYLLVWSTGWLLIALHFLSGALSAHWTLPRWFDSLNEWLMASGRAGFLQRRAVVFEADACGSGADIRCGCHCRVGSRLREWIPGCPSAGFGSGIGVFLRSANILAGGTKARISRRPTVGSRIRCMGIVAHHDGLAAANGDFCACRFAAAGAVAATIRGRTDGDGRVRRGATAR